MFRFPIQTTSSINILPLLCFSALRSFHNLHPQLKKKQLPQKQQRITRFQLLDAEERRSDDALVQPSKFFTAAIANQHRQKYNQLSRRNNNNETKREISDEHSTSFHQKRNLSSSSEYSAITARVEPHLQANEITMSRDPLKNLPSARLLKKMTYADALTATSSEILSPEDFSAISSSKEATTVRLQSHAHHEKLLFNQHSSSASASSGVKKDNEPVHMRCKTCFSMFQVKPKSVAPSRIQYQSMKDGWARDKKFGEMEHKYHKRGVVVASRSFAADPTRVNEPRCPKCGSEKTESLMQYLHVKNNARSV